METRTEYEEQKKLIHDLQNRLADAEIKIIEGEKLRKKLHNTILVVLLHWTFVWLWYTVLIPCYLSKLSYNAGT